MSARGDPCRSRADFVSGDVPYFGGPARGAGETEFSI